MIKIVITEWYLDDGRLCGSRESMERIFEPLIAGIGDLGLKVNFSKSSWTSRSKSFNKDLPHHLENIVILGSPIGDKIFSEDYCKKKYEKSVKVLHNIDLSKSVNCSKRWSLQVRSPTNAFGQ